MTYTYRDSVRDTAQIKKKDIRKKKCTVGWYGNNSEDERRTQQRSLWGTSRHEDKYSVSRSDSARDARALKSENLTCVERESHRRGLFLWSVKDDDKRKTHVEQHDIDDKSFTYPDIETLIWNTRDLHARKRQHRRYEYDALTETLQSKLWLSLSTDKNENKYYSRKGTTSQLDPSREKREEDSIEVQKSLENGMERTSEKTWIRNKLIHRTWRI